MLKYRIDNKKLILIESDLPSLKGDEILIEVISIGINRADLYQIQDSYPISSSEENTPGLEVAGVINSIGSDVSNFKIGDRVMALLSSGGYSQYVKVNQELVIEIPKEIDFPEAASVLETYATAYYNLVMKGRLSFEKKVLITGGASGVGSACIQVSKLYKAEITALVSSKDKASYCNFLGADKVIVYTEDFVFEDNYDIILDMYGGDFISQYLDISAEGGKVINIGLLKNKLVNIKMAKLLFKNISLIGSTLRNQPISVKKDLLQSIEREILPLFILRKIKFTIDSVFNFYDIEKALSYLEKGQHKGKIIVNIKEN